MVLPKETGARRMGWRCSNSVQPSRRPLRVGLPVARMDGRRRQRSGGRELAEVMRACTTGSDYANQIGLETDERSEHISEWAKRTQPEAPFLGNLTRSSSTDIG